MSRRQSNYFWAAFYAVIFSVALVGVAGFATAAPSTATPSANFLSPQNFLPPHNTPLPPNFLSDRAQPAQPAPLLFAQGVVFTLGFKNIANVLYTGFNTNSQYGGTLTGVSDGITYVWQNGTPAGVFSDVVAARARFGVNNESSFVLQGTLETRTERKWDTTYTLLRLKAMSGGTDYFSNILTVAQPPKGNYTLKFEDKVYASGDGITMTADYDGLTDTNNDANVDISALSPTFTWYSRPSDSATFAVLTTGIDASVYSTTSLSGAQRTYSVALTYTDGMDFGNTIAAVTSFNFLPTMSIVWDGNTGSGVRAFNSGARYGGTLFNGVGVISYQWEWSAPDNVFSSIPAAVDSFDFSATENDGFAIGNWNATNTQLRLRATDSDGTDYFSNTVTITQPPTGDYTLNFEDKTYYAGNGITMTADYDALTDLNNRSSGVGGTIGALSPTFTWYSRPSDAVDFVVLTMGVDASVYSEASLIDGTQPTYSVALTYTDGLGFGNTVAAVTSFNIVVAPPSEFTIDWINRTAANRTGFNHLSQYGGTLFIGIGNITYVWQNGTPGKVFSDVGQSRSSTGSNSNAAFQIDNNATTDSRNWDFTTPFLRLKATDSNGRDYFSNTVTVSQPPTGNITLNFQDKVYLLGDAATITANIDGLSDLNNNPAIGSGRIGTIPQGTPTFTWYSRPSDSAAFSELTSGVNASVYAISNLGGTNPTYSVKLTYTDGVGFGNTVSATASFTFTTIPTVFIGWNNRTAANINGFNFGSQYGGTLVNVGGAIAYQWQHGTTADDFSDITKLRSVCSADTTNNNCFELSSRAGLPDFSWDPTKTKLRLKATGGSTDYFSNIISIARPPTGDYTLNFEDKTYNLTDGLTITANTDGLTDPNNNQNVKIAAQSPTFTWYSRANDAAAFVSLTSGVNASVYITTGFLSGTNPTYRAVLTYNDSFGFGNTVTTDASINRFLALSIVWDGKNTNGRNGFNSFSRFDLTISIDASAFNVAVANVWQQGLPDGSFTDVPSSRNGCSNVQECFVIRGILDPRNPSFEWSPAHPFLRLKSEITEGGATTEHFSNIITITQNPVGDYQLEFDAGPFALADSPAAMITANYSALTDLNNLTTDNEHFITSRAPVVTWYYRANDNADFAVVASGVNLSVYAIKGADFSNLIDGQNPIMSVQLRYTDGMGFSHMLNFTERALNLTPPAVRGMATATKDSPQVYSASLTLTQGNTNGTTNYQWQRSMDNIVFTDIDGQTNQTYNLRSQFAVTDGSGWNTSYTHLRMQVRYVLSGATFAFNSDAFHITQPPFGNIRINQSGNTFSAITNNITAPNGIEQVQYQWYYVANDTATPHLISRATNRTYAIAAADFPSAPTDSPAISVRVEVRDNAGLPVLFGAKESVQKPSNVAANIIAPIAAAVHNAAYTATVNGGAGTNTYQWQGGSGGSFTNINGATNSTFILASGTWDTANTHLRVRAVQTNPSDIFTFSFDSAPIQISSAATATLDILHPTPLAVGSNITASVTITDDNNNAQNPGAVTYIWRTAQNDGSGTTLQQDARSVYVLANIAQADSLFVEARYVDSLGWAGTIAAQQLPPPPAFTISWTNRTGGRTGFNHGSAYGGTLTGGAGAISYQWQQGTPAGVFSDIDGPRDGCGGNGVLNACFEFRNNSNQETSNWDSTASLLRLKATDSDGADYFSNIIALPQPPTGNYTLNYEDKTYSAGDGITITANYNGLTDSNNRATQTTQNIAAQSPTFTWYSRADDSAAFVSLTTGINASVYTTNSISGTKLTYRAVLTYNDGMGFGNTVTAASVIFELPVLGDATATQTNRTYRVALNLTKGAGTGAASYLWQHSQDGNTFTNIDGQTEQTYNLQSTLAGGAGWNTLYSHLRARVQYTVEGVAYDFDSDIFNIKQPPAGNFRINPSGNSYVATTNNITAQNGIERVQYQWYFRAQPAASPTKINNATNQTYTPNAADLPILTAAESPNISVSVIAFDNAGFSTTFSDNLQLQRPPNIAANIINPTPNAAVHNAAYTANINTGTSANTYQWQGGSGGNFTDINGATNPTFILISGTWNIANTHLRLRGVHTN